VAEKLDARRLRAAVKAGRIEWQRHALERMAERNIPQAAVKAALLKADRIEEYPDAYPLPAALFLGRFGERPLHVVAAVDVGAPKVYVVTAYEPTLQHFEPDFRKRRK
jgi:hypothetical protein